MFVRPSFGEGVPCEHVHRSSYVVVHALFVRSPVSSDSSTSPSSTTDAGVPTSVGAPHSIVAVSFAELPEPHVAVAVLFGTSDPGVTV